MKAQVIRKFGEPSVFEQTEMPKPLVEPGHVLIQVKATSVNPVDTKVRSGAVSNVAPEFPAVLHGDMAGIVTEVGDGVDNFKPGDEVYGCAGGFKGTGGALAEYMLADADLIALKPKNLSMEEAAALPLVTITAWEALYNKAKIAKDQTILIHGATGGVGHIAIQLAKAAGARVFATGSTEEKLRTAEQLGAKASINYKDTSVEEYVNSCTNGKGFEVVFDTVGGENLDRSFEAAALHGTVLTIVSRSTHDLSPMHAKELSLHLTFMLLKILNKEKRKDHGNILRQVNELVEEGRLRPLLDPKPFTFEEITQAHAHLESGKAFGKIVLTNNWQSK